MAFRLRVVGLGGVLGCGALVVALLGCAPTSETDQGDSSTGGTLGATGGTGTGGIGAGTGGVGTGGVGTGTGGVEAGTGGVGTGGAVTGTGGAGTGGSAEPGACPTDAWFCTGFEEAGLPAGASYQPAYKASEWASHMALQSTVVGSKSQALEVKNTGEFWAMLSVPVQAATFWARLYVRSDQDLGQSDHNAFFMAMTGNGDQNGGDNVEIAEQYCQVVLNLHDDVVTSVGGTPQCGTGIAPLTKDTWHCMEAYFDGPNGTVQVYSDKEKIIDKSAWTKLDFKTFSFGYVNFHGPQRTMYYDDVAVGPTRIGCP